MAPTVMAIGGGKGGTGKSVLAVQIAIHLASEGHNVVLVDADPNGANLHTFFGLQDPSVDIDSLLDEIVGPQEAILPTGFKHLGLLSGTRQEMRPRVEPSALLDAVLRLRLQHADIVIWDVGSGTSMWSTYLFEQADVGLWVVEPEPTCIEREYHFLRHVCRWRVASSLEPEASPPVSWLPVPWLTKLRRSEPAQARTLLDHLRARPFLLVGNQIRTPDERELPEEMMAACRRFFGIKGEAIGWLSYDERLWLSVRERRPILQEYPSSRWVEQLQQMFVRLKQHLPPPGS